MKIRRLPHFLMTLAIVALVGCGTDRSAQTVDTSGELMNAFQYNGDFQGPLGLQLWSMREYTQNDVRDALRRVREMGFQEVELAGTYGMPVDEFRQLLDSVGLDATASHFPYERMRDSLEAVLDDAEGLGVDYLGIAWIPHEGPFDDALARQTAADFNRFGEAAAARGMTFFYHVHGYEFRADENGETPFDVLVAETNPESVKFEMDVFWTALPGVDPVDLLQQYPDRWELMHVKDMREDWPLGDHSGSAPAEADVPVGTGQIDYVEVLRTAREIGLDRYYIEDESVAPLENIPLSIQYLESVQF